jgi:hypothetical protein
MRRMPGWIALGLLVLSAPAPADPYQPGGNQDGVNTERHRRDEPATSSSAQWRDRAMREQERANDVNEQAKEKDAAAERARRDAEAKGDRSVPPAPSETTPVVAP